MDQSATYAYDSIQRRHIRLLRFRQDGNHTSAVLQTFSVQQPLPSYYALSYTWNSDQTLAKTWTVQIENQQLLVLGSLRPFVQALKSKPLNETWWWIDSICINQANLEERAQQVQLMQRIYRDADQVIVWLGEESSDSNLAVDFIELLDEAIRRECSVEEIRAMFQNASCYPQWTALTNFLSRKWWSRIWTIQEFVIPQRLSFWCGSRTISRTAVCHSLSVADKCTSVGIKETLAFRAGFNRRRAWDIYKVGGNPGASSLLALVAYFCFMDATDDRDRLYGIMALSTDGGSLLDVNYSLSSQEVYLRFTQAFIALYKSLDIICFASIYRAPPGLLRPSWVPDWQKREAFQVMPLMVSQSSSHRVGNLRSPKFLDFDTSISYSASKSRTAEYEFRESTLFARGVVLDEVDGLAGSRNFEMVQSSERSFAHSSDHSTPSSKDILTRVCRSLVLNRNDRFLRYAMPTAEFLQDFIRLCALLMTEPQVSIPAEFREWFQWTRFLRIHGHSLEGFLQDSHRACTDSSDSAPNQDEYIHDSFFGRFFDTVIRMSLRLMVTRDGHIGMASEKAMKGDLVCVLFGCSVPVILRKSEIGDSFTLIGECFLDGFMDGAAIGQRMPLGRTFRIQ